MKKTPLITIHVNSPHLKAVVAKISAAITRKVDAAAAEVKARTNDVCRVVNDKIDEVVKTARATDEFHGQAVSPANDSTEKEAEHA